MNTSWKIAGAVLVVAAIAGGVAYAATGNSSNPHQVLVPADGTAVVVTDPTSSTVVDPGVADTMSTTTTSTIADATSTTVSVPVQAAKRPVLTVPTTAPAPIPTAAPGSTIVLVPPRPDSHMAGTACTVDGAFALNPLGQTVVCQGSPLTWQLV